MKTFSILLVYLVWNVFQAMPVLAQSPKTEIRAVWVATVSNLDWPFGANKFDAEVQKESMKALLDSAVAWNLNTIFLQIRPQSDAFYESTLAPWSEYVSGARGTSPGYDPLLFAIEEAHKRGLEMHGWLNPYRYETFVGKNDGKPGDFNATHPEWMLNYDDDRIFNPGVPGVQQHLKEIVGEIINNYDIDGIHFDDYFYPYSGTGTQDQATFNTYGAGFANIGDWRRNNVNQMIAGVYDTIQSIKPFVRFGISPFGIYGNGQDPAGISGLDAYNVIFTDPIQWMGSGNIDYICPQLYWPTGGAQDFATLLPWWAQKAFDNNRHVIAGHGIYRLGDNAATARVDNSLHESKKYFDSSNSSVKLSADAWTLTQVSIQIDIIRNNRNLNALGSAFFRYQDFIRVNGLADFLVASNYNNTALMPAMTWKNQVAPTPPSNIRWQQDTSGISFITWDAADPEYRFVLYASATDSPPADFLNKPENIVKVLYNNTFYLAGEEGITGKPYLFITSYDRFGNESSTATLFSVDAPSTASSLIAPIDMATSQPSNFEFSWSSATNAQSYKLQVSSSNSFDEIDFETTISAVSINASELAILGNHQYYWRIIPVNFSGEGPISEVFSFTTGFPGNPTITSLENNEELVDLAPLITWTDDGLHTAALIQISQGGSQFETFNMVVDEVLGAASQFQVATELNEWTTHYLRLKLLNDLGESQWVEVTFKTLKVLPNAPQIYSPFHNEDIPTGSDVLVKWEKVLNSTGYTLKLSNDINVVEIVEEKEIYSVLDTAYTYQNLPAGEYYINVAGKNVGGNGEWAQIKFTIISQILGLSNNKIDNKYLSVSYLANGDVLVKVKRQKLSNFTLKVFDLYGREVSLFKLLNSNKDNLVFEIGNPSFRGIGIAILETNTKTEVIKFISQ
ncbi:MAG: family 10 glycosylhydrolase [Cyclobacteriaceae bacterium]|nr:family 10 glycosylhydrolase [Cyclobacteriaceae bacterium]